MGVKIHKSKMPPNKMRQKNIETAVFRTFCAEDGCFGSVTLRFLRPLLFAITVNGNNNGRNNSES